VIQEMLQKEVDAKGLAGTIDTIVRQELSLKQLPHHPLPLTIALQFYDGDVEEAMQLARMIADAEPIKRWDVFMVLVLNNHSLSSNALVNSTVEYVDEKMPTARLISPPRASGHPDGCFMQWHTAMSSLTRVWLHISQPTSKNVFTIEPDGCPTRLDWIDEIKRQHAHNLSVGKRVTGHLSNKVPAHVNGSLVMHASCWADHPSLHSCPSGELWDVFHGQVLSGERGPLSPIINLYGAKNMTEGVFHALAREYAWVSSVKDDSAKKCFQGLIDRRKESEGQHE